MTLAVRDSSGIAREVVTAEIRDAASVAKRVSVIEVRDAAGNAKMAWQAMSARAAPSSLRKYGAGGGDVTAPSSVGVTGGVAPFTYNWSRIDGGSASWTINSPGAASTTFTANDTAPNSATFQCLVTDASGNQATSNPVTASVIDLGTS